MKADILRILRDADGFVSGQSLCEQLGVSRTAIWKIMNQLKDEGYVIKAVNRKGYALDYEPDHLSAAEVKSRLSESSLFNKIYYFDEITSTNDYVKKLSEADEPEGVVVIADHQSAGKGRRGHEWVSPSGQNIYMSFMLKPELDPGRASMLTLVCALAVRDALKKQQFDPVIKWPNDLILSGKKVCGILTEMSTQMTCINYIVVGIGINVMQTEFDAAIKDVATSMKLESGRDFNRAQIAADLLKAFEGYYAQFLETKDLSLLKENYEASLANMDKEVRIIGTKEERSGIAKGIDNTGELLVEIDGKIERIMSGEVSVRGILGYV